MLAREVQLAGQDAVTAAVTSQKSDPPTAQLAQHEDLGRTAERRFDRAFLVNLELLHAVEAGAADDPYPAGIRAHVPVPAIFEFTRSAVLSARRPASPSTSAAPPPAHRSRNASNSRRSGSPCSTSRSAGTMRPGRSAGGGGGRRGRRRNVSAPALSGIPAPSAPGSPASGTDPRRRRATAAPAPRTPATRSRFATQPDSSSIRASAMSTRSDRTSIPTARTSRTGLGIEGVEDLQVVNHQVQHHIHIQAARAEGRHPFDFDEARPTTRSQQCLDGRIVELDVAHRQNHTARRRGRNQRVRLGEVDRDRLLHQDVDAGLDQTSATSR